MEVGNPTHDAEPLRNGGAAVFSGVGVHEAAEFARSAGKHYFGGFVAIAARPHLADRVTGMRSLQGLFEFALVEWLALRRYEKLFDQHIVNVVAEDHGAAADADDGDV